MKTTAAGTPNNSPRIEAVLSRRQTEIMKLIRQGASNREIASQLSISDGTVKLHVSAILKRLGLKYRTEAAQQRDI